MNSDAKHPSRPQSSISLHIPLDSVTGSDLDPIEQADRRTNTQSTEDNLFYRQVTEDQGSSTQSTLVYQQGTQGNSQGLHRTLIHNRRAQGDKGSNWTTAGANLDNIILEPVTRDLILHEGVTQGHSLHHLRLELPREPRPQEARTPQPPYRESYWNVQPLSPILIPAAESPPSAAPHPKYHPHLITEQAGSPIIIPAASSTQLLTRHPEEIEAARPPLAFASVQTSMPLGQPILGSVDMSRPLRPIVETPFTMPSPGQHPGSPLVVVSQHIAAPAEGSRLNGSHHDGSQTHNSQTSGSPYNASPQIVTPRQSPTHVKTSSQDSHKTPSFAASGSHGSLKQGPDYWDKIVQYPSVPDLSSPRSVNSVGTSNRSVVRSPPQVRPKASSPIKPSTGGEPVAWPQVQTCAASTGKLFGDFLYALVTATTSFVAGLSQAISSNEDQRHVFQGSLNNLCRRVNVSRAWDCMKGFRRSDQTPETEQVEPGIRYVEWRCLPGWKVDGLGQAVPLNFEEGRGQDEEVVADFVLDEEEERPPWVFVSNQQAQTPP
eukprot:Blabericola_migrator_1__10595@NODE_601_length_7399_cov_48_594790_g438_i0_p2_GENE_NODE_601_length_7399_cov_48_594790_g438_i0NODE_601_length_7399_cov_48_594790_g438_i0_p2_ORF_typecomplete_len546_score64_45EGF_MSP1_1/PF12946_7/64EGF_MSP1_1/PF12946_7/0_71_NODE_601_length_7399_cov_48_594790_g438_i041845821